MLEFALIINQETLYYIYSVPINPIKSMRSKVPKMKLQRENFKEINIFLKVRNCQLKYDALKLIY